jgi:hypothetical protein
MTVNSYQFEGHTTNKTWEVMPTIDVKFGQVVMFYGTNWGSHYFGVTMGMPEGATMAFQFGEDVFPSILDGKAIGPGVTVSGFIFLEAPKYGFDGTMRCRIRDAIDDEFVELVKPLQASNDLNTYTHAGQGTAWIPPQVDISKLPVLRYSETLDPR